MAIPILDIGCGISKDLNSALSTIDDMINDIINGIGDITGAIADAVSSALDALGTALGKMLPDISSLIPDISLSGAIEGLLGLVEGSLEYLAKLAEITLQFGQFILDSGFNLFDMIADAALAFLKGLNPCSALPIDASIGADGVAKEAPAAVGYGQVAAKKEPKKKKADFGTINKDKSVVSQADSKGRGFGFVPEGAGASTEAFISQADAEGRGFGFIPADAGASTGTGTTTVAGVSTGTLGTIVGPSFGGSGLQANNGVSSTATTSTGSLGTSKPNIYGGGGLQSNTDSLSENFIQPPKSPTLPTIHQPKGIESKEIKIPVKVQNTIVPPESSTLPTINQPEGIKNTYGKPTQFQGNVGTITQPPPSNIPQATPSVGELPEHFGKQNFFPSGKPFYTRDNFPYTEEGEVLWEKYLNTLTRRERLKANPLLG